MGGKKSNHLRRLLASIRGVRTWQLILILIPLLFVTATLLRLDHLKMVELRAAVLAADEAGDDAALSESLMNLGEFVFSHIVVNVVESNGEQRITFGTGVFYLEQQYLRAANAAIEEAESNLTDDANPNGDIYAAVRDICRPLGLANGWRYNSPGYLNCWTSELAKYPTVDQLADTTLTAKVPSTEEYRLEYDSPLWSFTPAGFAVLAAAILLIIIVVRIVIWLILQVALLFMKRF